MERRKLLAAAASSLALPFLTMGRAAHAQGSKPPLRLITIIESYGLPLGRRGKNWITSEAGDYALTPAALGSTLKPLAGYTDNLLLPTGIPTRSLLETGDTKDHNSVCHTLTGSRCISPGGRARPGPKATMAHASLDYQIGQHLNGDYGLASPRVYPHLFFSNKSDLDHVTYCYDNKGKQIRSIAGAGAILKSVFADVGEAAGGSDISRAAVSSKVEVLKLVQERVRAVRPQLVNANAGTVMEAYGASIEDFATELGTRGTRICEAPTKTGPAGDPRDIPFIMDAIAHVASCDLASSITYVIGGEFDDLMRYEKYAFEQGKHDKEVGELMGRSFHSASHRSDQVADAVHEIVRTKISGEIARLLDVLKSTPDVDGVSSVFDNTLLYFASNMSNNTHKQDNLPNAIIAGKNVPLRGGNHFDCSKRSNNDLLTTIGRSFSMDIDEFGGYERDKKLNKLNNGPIERMLRS